MLPGITPGRHGGGPEQNINEFTSKVYIFSILVKESLIPNETANNIQFKSRRLEPFVTEQQPLYVLNAHQSPTS
jgi:hypothetical protein